MAYKKLTSGSRIVFLTVTLIDILLANIIYYFIVNSGWFMVPDSIIGKKVNGIICATTAAFISVSIYSSIIHQRRISIMNVIMRVFRLAFIQSLLIMAMTRMMVDSSQSVMRLSAIYFAIYFVSMLVVRFLERQLLNTLRRMGHNKRTVVYVGSDPSILGLYESMMESASMAYNVLGYYGNNELQDCPAELKRLGTRKELIKEIKEGKQPFNVNEMYVSLISTDIETDVNELINYCDKNVIELFLIPRILSNLSMYFTPVQIGYNTYFTNHTNSITRIDNRIQKRMFDVVFSSVVCLGLLFVIPIIWIIIKIQSPGPLFFCQQRTGLNGETFLLYKFRSMHVNKDADKVQATKDDPRKFPFGNFMRRTNIDELPQFLNVLKGDMSIVGPRPHMLLHTEMYSKVISKYMVRHFSKPGITGWAQVSGFRGETKELWQMEERVKRDIWYNENWSFKLDLEIIARTVIQIFNPNKNAY